jgi:hypothetical protein
VTATPPEATRSMCAGLYQPLSLMYIPGVVPGGSWLSRASSGPTRASDTVVLLLSTADNGHLM